MRGSKFNDFGTSLGIVHTASIIVAVGAGAIVGTPVVTPDS